MESKLAGEYVHHYMGDTLVVLGPGGFRCSILRDGSFGVRGCDVRKPVQDICERKQMAVLQIGMGNVRIWRNPKWTRPRAFSAARAYSILLLTKEISDGRSSTALSSGAVGTGLVLLATWADKDSSSEIGTPLNW